MHILLSESYIPQVLISAINLKELVLDFFAPRELLLTSSESKAWVYLYAPG